MVIEEGLEDLVLVRIDTPLDYCLPQSPSSADHDDAGKSGVRVNGKHHPGSSLIGTDHALNTDGQGDVKVIEAFELSVTDGTVCEERGIAAAAGVEQFPFACN